MGPLRASLAVVLLFAAPLAAVAQALYDHHVIFDNSLPDGDYDSSDSRVIAPSTLETHNSRFPIETEHFVSPPNALRLRWKSASGGDWRMTLRIRRRYARPHVFEGDSLTFWCFADSEITTANAPLLFLQDATDAGTPAIRLVERKDRIPPGKWVQVKLPLAAFRSSLYNGTDDSRFIPRELVSVSFVQGLDDNQEHTLYLDDFQIRDGALGDTTAPAPPAAVAARGADRHFDVSWSASNVPDLLAYRIYRSWDGKTFEPVGTQQGAYTRFVNFVGAPVRTAYYRVTALDLAGNESPPSPAAQASTHAFTDDELLTMVQEGCFRFCWESAHPAAGLVPEVLPGDRNLLAVGGSGFGVMALLVATERQLVTRDQAVARMLQIVRFLAAADRFHGAWPHFLNGDTGRIIPLFGKYDNGGDLVETAFMIQGLLAARQYFVRETAAEREIRETITRLGREVEWDWYRQTPAHDVLYWHWSPDYGFHIGHPLIGWNETMIVHLLAIASPTHPVPASLYYTGWAGTSERHLRYRQSWSRTTDGDHYANGHSYYGIKLDVGEGNGADAFFVHFSFVGFDPRGRRDRFTNYFENNRAIVRINRAYCIENPRRFVGYGPNCWGLSAGIHSGGGRAQPCDDNGTISIMAALASMPYTPEESMAALKHYYRGFDAKVWSIYGFHDGFNPTENWFEEAYMALDQAPITVMIENYRSGLVWQRFMANPEILPALNAIGFKADAANPP